MSPRTATLYARTIVVLGALTLLLLGVLFILSPEDMATMVELELTTPLARGDIQTVYGGLEVGLGILLLLWSRSLLRLRPAIQLHLAIWGGLAGGRAASLALSSDPLSAGTGLFATELVGLGLGWSAWLVVRRFAK